MENHEAPPDPQQTEGPFDTIESAQEYLRLLLREVDANVEGLQEDIGTAAREGAGRRVDALRLAEFKLRELARHLGASRRILNDLRMLHRLLAEPGERAWTAGAAPRPVAQQPDLDVEVL
jgi:hypothetical protein